jgi:hypothetical protein
LKAVRVVVGLDPTYGEFIAKQRQSNMERDRVGERPVAVPVSLPEFVRFCEGRAKPIVAQYLLHFAIEHSRPR